ncbi:MAG: uroporphyrinogen decarboxylase family protein [Lachnospiraceae bacterium]|nr:uroporphyrinogen decarboxylase family protein [Lachnospiraceae bacterium]
MTGKEKLFATLRHEEVTQAPWVPFAGVHAGFIKGYTATEILTDADKLYECLMEANKLYMPDGQPIAFDLQLEAEQLGCGLMWADDNPPSVTTHPWENEPDYSKDITNTGRIKLVMDVAARMKESVGETTALYGLFCGPFTLMSHLRGTNLFFDMKKNPDLVKEMQKYIVKQCKLMIDWYDEVGMDVIVPVDPLISQISAKHFLAYMTEPYTEIFDYIRSKGKFSAFFVCGNAERNLEVMCQTKPDAISIDENIPMARAKAITDQYNVVIGGNIPLTTTMLFGNQMDNMKFVVDMVDSLDIPNKNLVIAPGCDMPYNVPVENGIAVSKAAKDLDGTRELVKNYEAVDDDVDVELPDYDNLDRPLLEACTLDSAQCAACGYMWAMVMDAKEKYGDRIDVVEYKYNDKVNIARDKKLGLTNLPTLVIDGVPKYVSIIPDHEEFFAYIDEVLKKYEK